MNKKDVRVLKVYKKVLKLCKAILSMIMAFCGFMTFGSIIGLVIKAFSILSGDVCVSDMVVFLAIGVLFGFLGVWCAGREEKLEDKIEALDKRAKMNTGQTFRSSGVYLGPSYIGNDYLRNNRPSIPWSDIPRV